jgi:GDP-D-mannose dehydratase
MQSIANPTKAFEKLGWKAKSMMREMIKLCIQAELSLYKKMR